jgi:hypothetical protein
MENIRKYIWSVYILFWVYLLFLDSSIDKSDHISIYLFFGWIPFLILHFLWKHKNTLSEDNAPANTLKKLDEFKSIDWLEAINNNLHEVHKNTTVIANHFLADNPAGEKSDKYKKRNNLIKIYARHLVNTKKLNEKDAFIRARFEVNKFGEEKVVEEIEESFSHGIRWKDQRNAEKEYYASGILEKDINEVTDYIPSHPKKPAPYYLAAPMYDILVKQIKRNIMLNSDFKKSKEIELYWHINENSYDEFVKNRAIIYHLERLGIIKKTNNESWGGKIKWTIPETEWSKVKTKIYDGESSHDDDYFEEKYRE